MERWEHYCENSYDCMRAVKHKWYDPNKLKRPILRLFYCDVSSCNYHVNNPSLISENARNNLFYGKTKKEKKIVRDHYLSPQFISRFIYDNQEIYLNNYEKFKQLFYISCSVIIVTQDENDALALLTKSDDKNSIFNILIPTDKKYDHVGIKLLRYSGSGKWTNREYKSVPNSVLSIPSELLEYEKQYLLEEGVA